jgi:hypothetical protein
MHGSWDCASVFLWRRLVGRSSPLAALSFHLRERGAAEMQHLKVLDLPRNFTRNQLKAAYLRKVLEFHPDKQVQRLAGIPKSERHREEQRLKQQYLRVVDAFEYLKKNGNVQDTSSTFTAKETKQTPKRNVRNHPDMDDEFALYAERLKQHKGPRYMSNGRMSLIIAALAFTFSIVSAGRVGYMRKKIDTLRSLEMPPDKVVKR